MPEQNRWQYEKIGASLAAFLLWAASAVLGLWEIWIVREMMLRVYVRFWAGDKLSGNDYWLSVGLGNWLVFILAVVWIGVVIGGGEYHAKHVGQPKSWKLFARTIGVQVAILVLALFI
jgi:hypothetical protein